MLKISIITVCYNSEKYIECAIQSLLKQSYSNIEYIIVDGGSNDRTLQIIDNYSDNITHFISDPDKGIYDAMNKGIAKASGDIIGFLNSDDFYAFPDAISEIISCFNDKRVDCIFGNINYVNADNIEKIVRNWKSGIFLKGSFKRGWHPAHPAFFVKKDVYDEFGGFDLSFKLAADFDLMLRFMEKGQITNYYYDKAIIHMRLGGTTSGSIKNIYKQNIECYKAFKKYDLSVSIFYPLYRIMPKIKQFIIK
jgi:glycosyltransferase involved in cell wall biosynthesis